MHDAGVAADGSGGDPTLADAVVAEIEAAGGSAVATYENLDTEAGCRGVVALAVERFGRLDVVVQNAGLLVWEELEEADRSWERLRRVNVDAPFHLARAAFPLMKREGYGRFVFTTSGRAMSVEDTRPGLAAYAVGKMAHFALMLVAAAEGTEHGILANAISPAAATRMLRRAVEPGELDPEQVSPAVVFLASEAAVSRDRCSSAPAAVFRSRAGRRASRRSRPRAGRARSDRGALGEIAGRSRESPPPALDHRVVQLRVRGDHPRAPDAAEHADPLRRRRARADRGARLRRRQARADRAPARDRVRPDRGDAEHRRRGGDRRGDDVVRPDGEAGEGHRRRRRPDRDRRRRRGRLPRLLRHGRRPQLAPARPALDRARPS